MADIQKRKAQRKQVKPRVGLCGPSGSGKTYSSLRMAYGWTGDWSKICLIDTEGGRGELYADTTIRGIHIGEYDYIRLDPPFTPRRYLEAIKAAESDPNIEVIIIDSLSHAWAGTGGMLEMKDNYAKNSKENSFTAWRQVTPEHNLLVDTVLRSRCVMFITVRSKTEYVIEDVNGKKVPKKIGLAPVFRDGVEYEMTVFMEVFQEHYASASKDNTGVFEGPPYIPTEEHGQRLLEWMMSGNVAPLAPASASQSKPKEDPSTNPQTSTSGNDQNPDFDVEKARRTFFAAMGKVGETVGVDKDFAVQTAKELVYAALNIESMSNLNTKQWASLILPATMDNLKKALVKAIEKKLAPKPDETSGIDTGLGFKESDDVDVLLDLHNAWDILKTPQANRKAVLANPNLDKKALLARLNAEIDQRNAEAEQKASRQAPPPESAGQLNFDPPPEPPVQAPTGAFF